MVRGLFLSGTVSQQTWGHKETWIVSTSGCVMGEDRRQDAEKVADLARDGCRRPVCLERQESSHGLCHHLTSLGPLHCKMEMMIGPAR